MRQTEILALLTVFLTAIIACDLSINGRKETPESVAFEKVEGYYVSDKSPIASPTTHLIIEDREEWDSIFIPKPPPYDSTRITPVDFDEKIAIAIIKHGSSYWEMEMDEVILDGQKLAVKYKADCVAYNMTWTANVPCIIQIKEIAYTTVSFFENDELVGKY
ncbi:MAG: hypothetical protein ACETWG_00585 [Candidatus Neomarinimicrobiota bacterium]